MPFGYWEAKDEADDPDAEIALKFRRGYPQDNIVFGDSTQAVLIQHRQEVMRCGVTDVAQLEKLLKLFFAYERSEIADMPDQKARAAGQAPKFLLKPDPQAGRIVIDSETVLAGVPPEAWSYRLGNRSAIDWVFDRNKERDHKEHVIDLLARVVRVSVETLRIVQAVKAAPR